MWCNKESGNSMPNVEDIFVAQSEKWRDSCQYNSDTPQKRRLKVSQFSLLMFLGLVLATHLGNVAKSG